jgi:predicted N-acetyltransferase YhbS
MIDTVSSLVPLTAVPAPQLEALLDRAFGPGRHARTAYKVREGTEWLPALSFAALDEAGDLAGSIQAWPAALTDRRGRVHPLLMVGPVAVLPDLQGLGYGSALMIAQASALAAPAALPQFLIGDPEYYGRFGFSAEHTARWLLPGPYEQHRVLARAANPAVLPKEGMLGPWRD